MSSFSVVTVVLILLSTCSLADEEISDPSGALERARRSITVDIGSKLQHRKLRIVTTLYQPYVLLSKNPSGGRKFTGFIPDLMFALSRRLRFDYEFYVVPDGRYGSYDETTDSWNGMIGEVIRNERNTSDGADIAAAPLTITTARENVVDFVKPFQHLGLTVLVKKDPPVLESGTYPYSFGIFDPLEPSVWGLVLLSTIVVGLFLWLINMYNPYEWAGRHAIGLADKDQSDTFNLAGSMWFAFTSLQWQGYERSPSSIAGRFLSVIWFVFVTILLVTYTAGVVNLLFWASTVHRREGAVLSQTSYEDLEHLLSDGTYTVGTLRAGSTHKYLMDVASGEEFDVLRRQWKMNKDDPFVTHTEEGVQRVRNSPKYAFILTTMEAKLYMNLRPCDLRIVGQMFAPRSYGWAVSRNSSIRDDISLGILELMDNGEIEVLEKKWWEDKGECWNATRYERVVTDVNSVLFVDKPKSVDMNVFWSPFVLLLVGVIISCLIAFAEMMYYRLRGRSSSQVTSFSVNN